MNVILLTVMLLSLGAFSQAMPADIRDGLASGTAIMNLSKLLGDVSFDNSTTVGLQGGWTMYKQCDSRWGNDQLGSCSGTSICKAGCAMSSVAMIVASKGGGKDPGTLNSWLKSNSGYSGCDIYWGSVDKLGFTSYQGMQTADYNTICNGISNGHGIVANVHNGGHWVLLTGCLGNNMYSVNDPGYSTTQYSHSEVLREAVYH